MNNFLKSGTKTYQLFGKYALIISWDQEKSTSLNQEIRHLQKITLSKIPHVIDSTIGYDSLCLYFDKPVEFGQLIEQLIGLENQEYLEQSRSILWEIPICFAEEFALDINDVCQIKDISIEALKKMVCDVKYDVAFLGFLPGFPYLTGLNSKLHCPRKTDPRLHVPASSVAIGGDQTGIYPSESPGGWQIIGRTPLNIFDISKEQPALFSSGDTIHFQEIDSKEFQEIFSQDQPDFSSFQKKPS